ncbi:MAG: hypothetical protein GAK40_01198 [Burkholderia plantarii]|nr:MAG: hypothetical protein GAK40_01198 [Burkholderia plantarii]
MHDMEGPDTNFSVQALLDRLRSDPRSSSEIARLCGISQPTVSRLRLSEGYRLRRSDPFIKLCNFYGIDIPSASHRAADYDQRLRDAIVEAWDGSDEHGRALMVVIQGLKGLGTKPG